MFINPFMPLRQLIDDSSAHMQQDGAQLSTSPAQFMCNTIFPQETGPCNPIQQYIHGTNTDQTHGNVNFRSTCSWMFDMVNILYSMSS